MHEACGELSRKASITANLWASMTDFSMTNPYFTKDLGRYARARTFKCFCSCMLG